MSKEVVEFNNDKEIISILISLHILAETHLFPVGLNNINSHAGKYLTFLLRIKQAPSRVYRDKSRFMII